MGGDRHKARAPERSDLEPDPDASRCSRRPAPAPTSAGLTVRTGATRCANQPGLRIDRNRHRAILSPSTARPVGLNVATSHALPNTAPLRLHLRPWNAGRHEARTSRPRRGRARLPFGRRAADLSSSASQRQGTGSSFRLDAVIFATGLGCITEITVAFVRRFNPTPAP